jgi:hypothetical protein
LALSKAWPSFLVWAALFASAASAQAQDRVRGLLSLPEVFGNGPCHPFEPEVVDLYAAPGAGTKIAAIQVDQHWAFAPHGGCEGLKVGVHRDGRRSDLPTLEYSYETPAAIVLAAQDGWFKIRLTGDTAWVRASRRDRFMPLADLFSEYPSLTALTDASSAPLLDAPGGAIVAAKAARPPGTPVRVIEVRHRGDETWFHVALMSHSICDVEREGPPDVVQIGWLSAHSAAGEPTVWFSSRGC